MRATTLFLFFAGILVLTGTAKYKTAQKTESEKDSSLSPWGDPHPPHKEEMLQEQEEEEDRYDIEDPGIDENDDENDEENDLENTEGKL